MRSPQRYGACAPSPRACGERVGVRGASTNADGATRGEPPSPRSAFALGATAGQALPPCPPKLQRRRIKGEREKKEKEREREKEEEGRFGRASMGFGRSIIHAAGLPS